MYATYRTSSPREDVFFLVAFKCFMEIMDIGLVPMGCDACQSSCHEVFIAFMSS